MIKFSPLEKMRFSEKIALDIQERIFKDELKRGDRLPTELALAGEFQVSRTVIREAMRILESLGLVTIKKGSQGGIFVNDGFHKPLSKSLKGQVDSGRISVDNIIKVRLLLEPFVAAEAAVNADQNDIEELGELLIESAENMDDPVFMQANRGKFHIRLARASGNPVLEMFMNSLIELLREYFFDFKDVNFERCAIESHRQIIAAVQQRDPSEARKVMERDILEIKQLVEADGHGNSKRGIQ